MMSKSGMIRVALDWTANTNHVGFFVSSALNFYKDRGISVEIVSAARDSYKKTPGRKLADREVEFAVAPSETAISFATSDLDKPRCKAVAALLQSDTSAIVTLEDSKIQRPAELDLKTYASYQGRFEMAIVQQLIKNDGGKGQAIEKVPPKLGIWDTILNGSCDSTWVFMAWEGLLAKRQGVKINAFDLGSYGIPYGYTPVLLAHPEDMKNNPEMVSEFLAATAEGYTFSVQNPTEAARILSQSSDDPGLDDVEFLAESIEILSDKYLDERGKWGHMNAKKWESFTDWLLQNNLLTTRDGTFVEPSLLLSANLYTNQFLR